MIRTSGRLRAVLGVAVLVTAGFLIAQPGWAERGSSLGLADDCGDCMQPAYCDVQEHVLTTSPDEDHDRHGEIDHGCELDWCSAAHEWNFGCWITDLAPGEERQLRELMTDPTLDRISRALVAFDGKVTLNQDREALQIRGCDTSIVVSIPLSAEQVGLLDS